MREPGGFWRTIRAMADTKTCSIHDCDAASHARGLCARHYGIAYRVGQIESIDRGAQHRITQADVATQKGICSICGPVRIRVRHGKGHQCWTLRLAERKRRVRTRRYPQSRDAYLRARYGITAEEYDRMLAEQGGVCAICHRPQTGKRLAVDHDHSTGAVRKLLCVACNVSLGALGEDVERLMAAISYIETHRTTH